MAVSQKTSGQFRKTRRGQRTDPDIQTEVEKLARQRWSAAAIYRKLADDPRFARRLPVARTIQNLVRAVTPRDSSSPWSLSSSDAEEAELVLPVLAATAEKTDGRASTVSELEAEWIVKLRRAAPDLPLPWVSNLAWVYMVRTEHNQSTAELDEMLGFAPWRSQEAFNRYLAFVYKARPEWPPRKQELYDPELVDGLSASITRSRNAYAMHMAADMHRDLTGQDVTYPSMVEGWGAVIEEGHTGLTRRAEGTKGE